MQKHPRYRFHCSGTNVELELDKRADSSPTATIVIRGKSAFELGLNLRHTRTEHAAFTELATSRNEYPQWYAPILTALGTIALTDESLSSLSFNRPYAFNVSFMDPSLWAFLENQRQTQLTLRARTLVELMQERGMVPSVVRTIRKDMHVYQRALELLPADEREQYHNLLVSGAEEDAAILESNRPELRNLRACNRGLIALEKKYNVPLRDSREYIKKRERFLRTASRYPSLQTLQHVHASLSVPPPVIELLPFGNIKHLPTTLHTRAHADYNPSIRTYQLQESIETFKERSLQNTEDESVMTDPTLFE